MRSLLKAIVFCLSISLTFTACQSDITNNIIQYPPGADAGPNQVIQLPATSFTLTGTGTSTNGQIVGYLWSLITGPNVPVIHSPSSPSTGVTNLMSGTYRFQFMVIDQGGFTGVDTVSVTVNPSAIQTLTLQPASNPNEVHLGYWNGDYSNRLPMEITAGGWTSGGTPLNTRGIFKFDLSSIPASATILTAKLTLYTNYTPFNGNLVDANSGPTNAMYIERNTSNWNTATVTWQTQPASDLATAVLIPHTNANFLNLVDIDVKNLVVPMTAVANYGFKIRLQNEVTYNIRQFCASRYADASRHPKLVVTYQ